MSDLNKYVEKLIDMLKNSKASSRYEACLRLRVLPNLPPEAILALREALNDPDKEVAEAASQALELISTPAVETTTGKGKPNPSRLVCPSCGAPEHAYLRVCQQCGAAYATEDMLELRQLEYLLAETASWPGVAPLRDVYSDRLVVLKKRILPAHEAASEEVKPVKTVPVLEIAVPAPTPVVARAVPAITPTKKAVEAPKQLAMREPREGVPFDQWLLSDRNIKIALYSGGALLVLAGLIFVGVNWSRLPGLAKFAITLFISGLMYLGGYLLFRRPMLKVGGVALLAVACAFIPLNFAILQIYIFEARGLSAEIIWLIGSVSTLLLYMVTAYWTRASLFTYFSMAAIGSTLAAGLTLFDASPVVYVLSFAIMSGLFLVGAHLLRSVRVGQYTWLPLLIVAQIAMQILALSAVALWLVTSYCTRCLEGSPWILIATLFVGVAFYIATDLLLHWHISRWVASSLLVISVLFLLTQANILATYISMSMMILFLATLVGGYTLQRLSGSQKEALPLLIIAHITTALGWIVNALFWLIQHYFVPINGGAWPALAGMAVGVFFYLITDLLFHWRFARWVQGVLFALTFIALLIQVKVPATFIGMGMMVLFLAYLGGGYLLERRSGDRKEAAPLLIIGHTGAAIGVISNVSMWLQSINCHSCIGGGPWPALAGMLMGVGFYVATDLLLRWRFARWVSTFLFAITFLCILMELELSSTVIGISLMVLALLYLLVGKYLEIRGILRAGVWPLYAAGSTVAAFVTVQALAGFADDPSDLAKILIGDVALLAVSAWIHKQYEWIYGAVWVFMAPVIIYASIYLPELFQRGIVLGVLMLICAAAGYFLGRRSLKWGGPFLTAAVFLSLVVTILTWENAIVLSISLAVIASLYCWAALWRKWSWMLLPSSVALELLSVAILMTFFTSESPWVDTLAVTYAAFGVVMTLGGAWLRIKGQPAWGWPLYLVGGLNIFGSYIVSFVLLEWIAISLSLAFAALSLGLAWWERRFFMITKIPPLFAYIGAALVFSGHFFVLEMALDGWKNWTAFTAGLSALLVVIAWLFRKEQITELYGTPVRRVGAWMMLVPVGGHIFKYEPITAAITFGLVGVALAADAAVRRIRWLFYLAGGAFVVVIWTLFDHFNITELQAYAVPLGICLVAIGWSERQLGRKMLYLLPGIMGLLILMGTAFYQSLEQVIYAVAMLVESLLTIGWGIRIRSRSIVELGMLAVVVNGIAQLGPGFVELPRWVQLGSIGIILLGGGLAALFRREKLLTTRKRLADEWKKWER